MSSSLGRKERAMSRSPRTDRERVLDLLKREVRGDIPAPRQVILADRLVELLREVRQEERKRPPRGVGFGR